MEGTSSLAVSRKLFCEFYENDYKLNLYMFSLHYITDIFTSVIQISARHKAIGMMQFKIKHFQVRPSVHTSH
jgi:hypothetical protein